MSGGIDRLGSPLRGRSLAVMGGNFISWKTSSHDMRTLATVRLEATRRERRPGSEFWRGGVCGLLALLVLTLPGCGGCLKRPPPTALQQAEEDEEKRRREEEERRREQARLPLNLGELRIQPYDRQANLRGVKPGHWMSAVQAARANHADVQGELRSFAVDSQGAGQHLEFTPYQLITSRPAALPKGQTRYFETLHRIPLGEAEAGTGASGIALERLLVPRRGGRDEARDRQPTTRMPGYQFYLIILAETPDQYTFSRRLHSVATPPAVFAERPATRYYSVVIPERTTGIPPLPTHPLAWTSIAYLVWDNFQPNLLAPAQQSALVDWLHWGGQLVISGPGSLEKLSGSFLEPYLPADRVATVELRENDFVGLNDAWSLVEKKTGKERRIDVEDSLPIVGLELKLREKGSALPGTGGLVVERPVGVGRIAVTAFSLSDRAILSWGSFDSFFNGALLRRPARRFQVTPSEDVECHWRDFSALNQDARLVSGLRYFSRDAAREEAVEYREENRSLDRRVWGTGSSTAAGVAAWNDFSAVPEEARQTLRDAAGISIPSSTFVLRVVLVYLLVLTPLNWGFFRLLGRVEWAWFAAPLIAIVASLVVVRLAQLDIGFARSQTEIATLEIQAAYPRAHLTRFTALYSSLSTRYDVRYDDPNSLVQPFASSLQYRQGAHEPTTLLTLHRDRQLRLSGLSVMSNSTGMLRSEQMLDLGGILEVRGDAEQGGELFNGTELSIRDAGILHRNAIGDVAVAWLGDLSAKSRRQFSWDVPPSSGWLLEPWREAAIFSRDEAADGSLRLDRIADLATQGWPLGRGEMRLVGWSEENWPGQMITPLANQQKHATLVVAHLRTPLWPRAERDENLFVDVADPAIGREPLYDAFWDDDGDLGELPP